MEPPTKLVLQCSLVERRNAAVAAGPGIGRTATTLADTSDGGNDRDAPDTLFAPNPRGETGPSAHGESDADSGSARRTRGA